MNLTGTCTNIKFKPTAIKLLAQMRGSNPKLLLHAQILNLNPQPFNYQPRSEVQNRERSSYLQKSDVLTQNASITCTIVKFKPTTFTLPDLI